MHLAGQGHREWLRHRTDDALAIFSERQYGLKFRMLERGSVRRIATLPWLSWKLVGFVALSRLTCPDKRAHRAWMSDSDRLTMARLANQHCVHTLVLGRTLAF